MSHERTKQGSPNIIKKDQLYSTIQSTSNVYHLDASPPNFNLVVDTELTDTLVLPKDALNAPVIFSPSVLPRNKSRGSVSRENRSANSLGMSLQGLSFQV